MANRQSDRDDRGREGRGGRGGREREQGREGGGQGARYGTASGYTREGQTAGGGTRGGLIGNSDYPGGHASGRPEGHGGGMSGRGEGFGGSGYGGGGGSVPGYGGFGGYGATTGYSGYGSGENRQQRRGPHAGRGPQGYQRSNERIMEEACERLTQHDEIDARGIKVEVDNGEVTLTGTVSSRYEKRLAEDILDSISGVKDVHNQLRIRREGGNGQDRVNAGPGITGTTSDSTHGGASGLGSSNAAAAGAGSAGMAPNESSSEGTRSLSGDREKDNDTPSPGGLEDYEKASPRARGKGRK